MIVAEQAHAVAELQRNFWAGQGKEEHNIFNNSSHNTEEHNIFNNSGHNTSIDISATYVFRKLSQFLTFAKKKQF